MKKNSHKSSFNLLLALFTLLLIGLIFGAETLRVIVIHITVFAVAIFIIGVAIVLGYTIWETIRAKKDDNDETPFV